MGSIGRCLPTTCRKACTFLESRTKHTSCRARQQGLQSNCKMFYTSNPNKTPRVAVLYQALEPPVIDGIKKPKKPGGYRDSGADIAYNLRNSGDVEVVCPKSTPDPINDSDWCFPDTEEGILEAIGQGATHLWANTILFASHLLQISKALDTYQDQVHVIGQGPLVVEKYDDKEYVNDLLRRLGGFSMPKAWTAHAGQDIISEVPDLSFPVVAKPIRGRGSQGVRVCHSLDELVLHAQELFRDSSSIMLEEFLSGEEITITVMPPTKSGYNSDYWALPVVTRFNHQQGIAPYNGVVAVTSNSRAILESQHNELYDKVIEECKKVARALGTTAPIRIDARRYKDSRSSKFALFDVNMKPNMTGPGRPGRDDQASLTLIVANALGWDYQELLKQILTTSHFLRALRRLEP
ncbi:glutathione synthetase ATP-binding domain-like protein, partial [Whalleya microplaca]